MDTHRDPNRRIQVAIVEDSTDVQLLLDAVLEHAGLQVCCIAGSIADALAHLPDSDPDVIVLDQHLGDGMGHSLIPGLRERGMSQPIVVLTGDPSAWTAAVAHTAGAVRCVDKAASNRLGDILRSVVDDARRGPAGEDR